MGILNFLIILAKGMIDFQYPLPGIINTSFIVRQAQGLVRRLAFFQNMEVDSNHILPKALTFFISAMCRDEFQSSW